MTHAQLLEELTQGVYHPIYLLQGEEPYFIDLVSDYIEQHALDDAGKAFNQMIYYGKEIDVKSIVDEAQQYPMMADKRVIIIKEAQDLSKIQDLHHYATKPSPTSILVLAHKYKKVRGNTKLAKAISKSGIILNADKIRDYKLGAWIQNYVTSKGYTIDKNTANLIAEYLGTDLSKVTNEIGKLILNLEGASTITTEQVQDQIGISKDYNVFELQKALSSRDVLTVHRIINFFAGDQKNNHITMTLSSLYGYFQKVHTAGAYASNNDHALMKALGMNSPYFVKEYRQASRHYPPSRIPSIFAALATADKQSKGVGSRSADALQILRQLVLEIMI